MRDLKKERDYFPAYDISKLTQAERDTLLNSMNTDPESWTPEVHREIKRIGQKMSYELGVYSHEAVIVRYDGIRTLLVDPKDASLEMYELEFDRIPLAQQVFWQSIRAQKPLKNLETYRLKYQKDVAV